jgi:acetoin utilization deacetylase AcuC-like enzyme
MFCLEGGYDLVSLASSVVATLDGAVSGKDLSSATPEEELQPRALQMLARTLDAVRPFWSGL